MSWKAWRLITKDNKLAVIFTSGEYSRSELTEMFHDRELLEPNEGFGMAVIHHFLKDTEYTLVKKEQP